MEKQQASYADEEPQPDYADEDHQPDYAADEKKQPCNVILIHCYMFYSIGMWRY